MAIKGINHVTLKVRDLEKAREFYELLGFRESGRRERMLFFSLGDHHHHIALFEMGPNAQIPPGKTVGMAHFALTVEHESELGGLYNQLTEAGYDVTYVIDHVTNRSFYVTDADGNSLEITYDVPRAEWAGLENPFAEDRPYTIPGAKES